MSESPDEFWRFATELEIEELMRERDCSREEAIAELAWERR